MKKMHEDPIVARDAVILMETEFTQGGVNMYKAATVGSNAVKTVSKLRDGWIGWQGNGGSVFQWHPGLEIAFGWCGNFIHGADLMNTRGAKLQAEVVKLVNRI